MGQIQKGEIASIKGNYARIVPSAATAQPTAEIITIPWHLRGDAGKLKKGTKVVYVEFEDNTGLLLGRADGDWGEYLPNLTAGNVTSGGVSLKNHTHGVSGSSTTKPE